MHAKPTVGTKLSKIVENAKVKMTETISGMKTKEGRKAFEDKAKNAAIAAKDKTVALWKSGPKGKAGIVAAALVAAWIILPFGGGKDSAAAGSGEDVRAMADAGLKKMHGGDTMFYESGEKFEIDDKLNYNLVKPNLYVLPPFIKTAFLETAVYPSFEKEKGDAFAPKIGGLEVISVDDGCVLIGLFNDVSQEWFYACVKTDDEYADGQALKAGFYAYAGTQSIAMSDGSKRTMPAFEKLPNVYLEAVAYNDMAEEAAEAENQRRKDEVLNKYDASAKDAVAKMVLEMAKDAEVKELSERVHIPAKLQGKAKVRLEPRWKWVDDPSRTSANFIGRDEFISRMEKGELPCFLQKADRNDTKERMQEEVDTYYRKYRVVAEIPSGARLDIYTVNPNKGVSSFIPQYNSDDLFDALTHVAVVEAPQELPGNNTEEITDGEYDKDGNFKPRPEDPLRSFHPGDVGKFMEAYERIYGK